MTIFNSEPLVYRVGHIGITEVDKVKVNEASTSSSSCSRRLRGDDRSGDDGTWVSVSWMSVEG